jgi:Tfp pilus assembly protein PilZ
VSEDNAWCSTCCTQHGAAGDCPGPLLATGPEGHARKFSVAEKGRLEYYGVLIAEAGDCWRARVFTYPNMLWSVPGGRGTIKFAGATAKEAETLAVEFLREHCESRNCTMQDAADEPTAGWGQGSTDSGAAKDGKEQRHPCKVPIRFGEEKAIRAATTANLSPGGIYIATDKPIEKGKSVRMLLDVQAYTIPLVGTVAWVRVNEEVGKPKGMGVQLNQPPALFLRYVATVQEQMAEIEAASAKPTEA